MKKKITNKLQMALYIIFNIYITSIKTNKALKKCHRSTKISLGPLLSFLFRNFHKFFHNLARHRTGRGDTNKGPWNNIFLGLKYKLLKFKNQIKG